MAKGRREREAGDREQADDWHPGQLSPGKRALTSFASNKPPPIEPGKRSLTQHMRTSANASPMPAGSPTDPGAGALEQPAPGEYGHEGIAAILERGRGADTAAGVKASLGAGTALDAAVAAKIGAAFGTSFSEVRIHTDTAGAALAARYDAPAVTIGNDIAFAPGMYRPNTIDGDALIAHELAHVVQQRGSDSDAQKALQNTESAHETEADDAARAAIMHVHHGVATAAARPALTSGTRIARGHPIVGLDAPATRIGVLALRPALPSGEPAIVGMTLRANLDRTYVSRDVGTVFVGSWDLIGPSGRHFAHPSIEIADFPITEVGDHLLKVEVITERAGSRTTEIIQHRFTAVKKETRTRELLAKVGDANYDELRAGIEMQESLLSPPGPDAQAHGDYRINTPTSNPVAEMPSDLFPPILFHVERTAAGPPPPGLTYHWYVKPLNKTKGYHRDRSPAVGNLMPTTLDGQPGYHDLGKDEFARLVPNERNVYIIVCRINDSAGKRFGEARYVQTVLSKDEQKDFDKFQEYRGRVESLTGKLDGVKKTVLTCVHVATDTAQAMRPLLVAGVTASGVTIVDLTPGLDPKEHKLEFHGADLDAAIAELRGANRYPRGHLRIAVPNEHYLGASATGKQYELETNGESDLEKWSGRFGLASLALLIGAAVAAPFTGGGSVVVTLLLLASAATGVVAASLSLAERLRHAEISPTGVALDIVAIVGSLISGAAAVRALGAAGNAINIAGRAARFILWSNFVTSAVAAVLVSVEAIEQIREILDSDLSTEQKMALLVRVVTNMALTGAILALSYKDMNAVRSRLGSHLPAALEGALTGEARLTLNLLDDGALHAIGKAAQPATAEELTRLARILRSDSQLIQRVAGRTDLLDILRLTRGETRNAFELGMLRHRLTPSVGAAHAERVANALELAHIPGQAANDLSDQALTRIATDPERAGALYQQYGDNLLRSVGAAPNEPLDRIAEQLARANPRAAQQQGVFELTNTRVVHVPGAGGGINAVDGNLSPNDLNKDLRGMQRHPRLHGATVTFEPRSGAGTQSTGLLGVTDAHGKLVTIEVEVSATRSLATPGGAAGREPARLDLLPPDAAAGHPNWRAKVTISNRVQREDVALVVGRELDEAIDVARRGDTALIAAEQRASAFKAGARQGGTPKVTSADRAAVHQLEAMYGDLDHRQQVLGGHERAGTANARMRNDVQSRAARVQRHLQTMGLDDPKRFMQGQKVLRQLGVPEPKLKSLQVFVEQRSFAALPHPGLTATQPVITTDIVDHLLHPRVQAPAMFVKAGIDGGHQTENLLRFVNDNPQYAVVERQVRSSGGTLYRKYDQYRWIGGGTPPPLGDARRPGGRTFDAAKWELAGVPKTTADQLQPYLRDAEGAWEKWRSANFTPGATPSGPASLEYGQFTTPPSPGGVSFEGGFRFTPGPPPRWTFTTVYPKL